MIDYLYALLQHPAAPFVGVGLFLFIGWCLTLRWAYLIGHWEGYKARDQGIIIFSYEKLRKRTHENA